MSGHRTHQPNHALRQARLGMPSPHAPFRSMSRRELADAVNAWLHQDTGKTFCLDGNHIGKYELGEYTWPHNHYRRALRAILNAASDSEIGFHPRRRTPPSIGDRPTTRPDHPAIGRGRQRRAPTPDTVDTSRWERTATRFGQAYLRQTGFARDSERRFSADPPATPGRY